MASLFDIGLSGVRAAKYAMYLTGNNIANANNPYYTRREVDFIEVPSSLFSGGVNVGDVRRIVDTFSNNQLIRTNQEWSKADVFYERMKHLETFMDNNDSSSIKFINESLSALEIVNTTPGSKSGRNYYLSQLGTLANRIQQIDHQFKSEATETKKEIGETVDTANSILGKLAYLNQQIAIVSASSEQGSLALLDQRDELVTKLSSLVDFTHSIDEAGRVSIQLNNGLPLLVGDTVNPLVLMNSGASGEMNVGVVAAGVTTNVNDLFSSGKIKGLIEYYDTNISHAQRQMDLMALNIAEKLNHQNKSGVDATGALGGLIFKDINNPLAMSNRVLASLNNTGSGDLSVSIDNIKTLTADEYTLHFDTASDYTLVRASDGAVVQSGSLAGLPQAISAGGFSIMVNAGTFSAGDSYSISPTRGAAHDIDVIMTDGSGLALGLPVVTKAASHNLGSGAISLTDVIDTTNPAFSIPKQLNPPLRVEFITPTTYRLVNSNDNSLVEDNLTYDPTNGSEVFPTSGGFDPGFRIHLAGSMQAGDAFLIDYNSDGLGDNRNGLLMADLYRDDENGNTFSRAYQTFILDVATATNQAKISLDSTTIMKNQAQNRRDEVSGVSLEEETMNLARYQEYYMASAQVLDAMKVTMDVIMSLMRS